MRTIQHLLVAWVASFFLCGAIVFPIMDAAANHRDSFTFGIAGMIYGVESVLRAGHIETCGFLSGNCHQHSVRAPGLVLWFVGFVGLWVRDAMRWRRVDWTDIPLADASADDPRTPIESERKSGSGAPGDPR